MSGDRLFRERGGEPAGLDVPQLHELRDEFQVLDELGRGGTAVVYRAVERALDREVAIKVVRASHLDDEEAAARLVREARMVALLRHPQIVTLFGTRTLSSGGIALIMQYVPGRTLKQAIRQDGPFPVAMVKSVLREIGSALDYAHRRHGIVHRDIKPENIYLDGEHGQALLADFGIARTGDGESTLTLAGSALGTPAYMSPEQIDGSRLDGRSDLYSLGLVAYEMLTGRQPWEGKTLYGIIYKQKNEDLPPLSELRPDLPENLDRAVEGLLRKDRTQRWSDAAQFLAQLRLPAKLPPRPRAPAQPTVARPPVREDSPTIRYQRDQVEAGGDPAAEAAPAEVGSGARSGAVDPVPAAAPAPGASEPTEASPGAIPADVLHEIEASVRPPPPQQVRSGSPTRWRQALALAVVLVAIGLVSALGGPGLLERVLPGEAIHLDAPVAPSPASLPATPPGPPDLVAIVAGDGQQGAAGLPLPRQLQVRVADDGGRPVAAAEVEFQVTAGAGSVAPDLAVTDSSGLAVAAWTLGEPGVNEVVARVRSAPDRRASFLALAFAGVPARIAVTAGDDQAAVRGATLPGRVAVRVEDERGTPLDGVTVVFRVTAGGGSVRPETVRAQNGMARATWTLGDEVGPQTLVAEVPDGGPGVTVAATARYRLDPAPRIAAGGTHTCRLLASGGAHCWGGNDNGQLGAGATGRPAGATTVQGSAHLARLATGVSHTCALDRDGAALCWGMNNEGQLGTGDRTPRPAPAPVRGVESYMAIVAGLAHTCALTDRGAAFCWGAGRYGQLGDGTGQSRPTPTPVAGGARFTALTAGWNHTCALTGDGAAYCWGVNADGQIGDGATVDRAAPTPVAGELRFRGISAGATHTCGITTDGQAYCWGEPLGAGSPGSTAGAPTPALVEAPEQFVSSVAGALHACALTRDGVAYCWGRNSSGQLGTGTTEDAPAAVRVAGGIRFSSLTARGSHTCGRAVTGEDYCWGYNVEGQLGDGSRTRQALPVRVAPGGT